MDSWCTTFVERIKRTKRRDKRERRIPVATATVLLNREALLRQSKERPMQMGSWPLLGQMV
jgi:hypothetical protein